MNCNTKLPDFKRTALSWYVFGFPDIPIIPGLKRSTVKWKPWLATLSQGTISAYWAQHPDPEVGFIVGDGYIVFDADSKMAIVSLYDIEEAFDLSPACGEDTFPATPSCQHRPENRPTQGTARLYQSGL